MKRMLFFRWLWLYIFHCRSQGLTKAQVRQWMAEKLSAHKQLDGGIVFLHSIPKSASGKILRRELVGK